MKRYLVKASNKPFTHIRAAGEAIPKLNEVDDATAHRAKFYDGLNLIGKRQPAPRKKKDK